MVILSHGFVDEVENFEVRFLIKPKKEKFIFDKKRTFLKNSTIKHLKNKNNFHDFTNSFIKSGSSGTDQGVL